MHMRFIRSLEFDQGKGIKTLTLFLLLIFVAGPQISRGQDADLTKITPPPKPYVGSLKGNIMFTTVFTYKTAGSHPEVFGRVPTDPDIKEIDTVVSGTLRKDRQLFADGTNTEIWRSGPYRLIVYSSDPSYILAAIPSPNGFEDATDFKELDWINGQAFQGEQVYQGKKCFFYKAGTQSAWIDESSLLPLYFESDIVQATYSCTPFENGPLQLPDKFEKRLQELKQAWSGH